MKHKFLERCKAAIKGFRHPDFVVDPSHAPYNTYTFYVKHRRAHDIYASMIRAPYYTSESPTSDDVKDTLCYELANQIKPYMKIHVDYDPISMNTTYTTRIQVVDPNG